MVGPEMEVGQTIGSVIRLQRPLESQPQSTSMYHKVREYFVYRDGQGLGSMAIHLAQHCFSFNMRVTFDCFT